MIDLQRHAFYCALFSGAEGNRTPVQTYPSKAFYMLILVLLVGKWPEPVEPIISLAV